MEALIFPGNPTGFGTVYNTLAAAWDVSGDLIAERGDALGGTQEDWGVSSARREPVVQNRKGVAALET